jgi:uncharacterized lipoprotein YmbA
VKPSALMIMVLTLATCVACTSPPIKTRYFSLVEGKPIPEQAAGSVAGSRVSLGPAAVPEAVDRRQMVLRIAPDQNEISDAYGWTSPLKNEIPRAVADEIAARLPAARVAVYPLHSGQDGDYRLDLNVVRFESTPNASVNLEVAWRVRSAAGEPLRASSGSYVVPVTAPGIEAVVSAHRKALAMLGNEIAAALGELMAARRDFPRFAPQSGSATEPSPRE